MKKKIGLFSILVILFSMTVVPSLLAQSIVVNGEFSAGNTGFSTGYAYTAPGAGNLWDEGKYTVDDNPHDSHQFFCDMGDHTTGSGQMMIINGAPALGTIVWQGSINMDLKVGESYDFSAWVTNVNPAAPAKLTFKVGGTNIGTLTPSGNCSWQRLYGTFTASSARPTLILENAQDAADGNDFAIDDINIFLAGSQNPPEPEAPEINVIRPSGTSIPDGGTDNVGSLTVGCDKTFTYTIDNSDGTLELNVSSATASNMTRCSNFQVLSNLPVSIPVGSSAELEISFCVTNKGPFGFEMDINNDDSDENPYDIYVTGLGLGPEIDIQRPKDSYIPDGGSDDLGEVQVGCERSITYVIDNTAGGHYLDVTGVSAENYVNCSDLVCLTGLPLRIPAGAVDSVKLEFCVTFLGPFSFDLDFDNTDEDEDPYDVSVSGVGYIPNVDFCGQFDSDCNVGLAPVIANFFTLKPFLEYKWNYGDRTDYLPYHIYWDPCPNYGKTPYDVSLNSFLMREFIQVYEPNPSSLMELQLVSSSPCDPRLTWENAIDGDIYWLTGAASVIADNSGQPWAIFEFSDQSTRMINKIRFLNDTGMGRLTELDDRTPLWAPNFYNQVREFSVYVSTSGTAEDDFVLLGQAEKMAIDSPCEIGDDWESYETELTAAKYIKLVINQPETYYRQFGEFEVYAQTELASVKHSSITTAVAVGSQMAPLADGKDKSVVTLTLADENGNPLTGKTSLDIKLFGVPKYGYGLSDLVFDPIVETEIPGVYRTFVASTDKLVHLLRASVNGVVIDKISPESDEVCELLFGREDIETNDVGFDIDATGKNACDLVFVEGTPTSKGQGWDNAVDGDFEGWDGTVTARGLVDASDLAWGTFCFADQNTYKFNYIYLQVDNGTADDAWEIRHTNRFELFVSTTGTAQCDFSSIGQFTVKGTNWQLYKMPGIITAKYVKIALIEPTLKGWRQIVEFDVTMNKLDPVLAGEQADVALLPNAFALEQNYPNPFNPVTTIRYQLPARSNVTLKVFDVSGREVATLVDEEQGAGFKQVSFDATGLTSGIYFYKIQTASFEDVKRMLLVK